MHICKEAVLRFSRRIAFITLIAVVPASTGATVPQGTLPGQRIATGNEYTCAITEAGSVECWGRNFHGQLGDGSFVDHSVPSTVFGVGEPALAIAAGDFHACVVTVSGAVKCWGQNWAGQLGNDSTESSTTPVDVVGLASGVVSITAGRSHTCALTSTAELKCWGRNSSGQLGDLTKTDRHTPVHVLDGILDVAAGSGHTCAATQSGMALCWGEGYSGQLGNGETNSSPYPESVTNLTSGVSAVTAGWGHSCALMTAGAVKCWGSNLYGQLGDSTMTNRLTPVDVTTMAANASAVSAGTYHTCAIQQGAPKCWGLNSTGRLGDGTRANRAAPIAVTGIAEGVQQIDAGGTQSCAWMGSDSFLCWGNNSFGQVGDGNTGHSTHAVDIVSLSTGTSAIGVGYQHMCAISDGAVVCWGDNRSGQLGDGTHEEHVTPMPTSGLASGMVSISVADNHACALTQDGSAKCWGDNAQGQLGDGTQIERSIPVDVVGLGTGVRQIGTSGHTCALTAAGGVMCWGQNDFGELGDNSTVGRSVPGDVAGLASGVAAIAVGSHYSCALLDAGSVKCWGIVSSDFNTSMQSLVPADVPGLESNVTAITSGASHHCAVIGGNVLKCWGMNDYGMLGNGTIEGSMNPVEVTGLSAGVANASAGGLHTCAVDSAGAAKCWGLNETGELGDGTLEQRLAPVNVSGLGSGMASISAGSIGSCAISTSGQAKCWGDNLFGQLGNGETGSVLVPHTVLIGEEVFRSGFE